MYYMIYLSKILVKTDRHTYVFYGNVLRGSSFIIQIQLPSLYNILNHTLYKRDEGKRLDFHSSPFSVKTVHRVRQGFVVVRGKSSVGVEVCLLVHLNSRHHHYLIYPNLGYFFTAENLQTFVYKTVWNLYLVSMKFLLVHLKFTTI